MIMSQINEDIGLIVKNEDVFVVHFFNGKRKIKISNSLLQLMGEKWFNDNVNKNKWFWWRRFDYFDETDNAFKVVAYLSRDV